MLEKLDIQGGAGKVSAETYQSTYCSPFADTIFLRRDHRFSQRAREIDCYGNFWCFAFSNFEPGQVYIKTRGRLIEASGPCALWTPRYSVIDWNLSPGAIRWYAYMSKYSEPSDLSHTAKLIRLTDDFVPPSSLETVFDLVRNATDVEDVEKVEDASSVAVRTKEKLSEYLGAGSSLQDIARELGYSPSVMTRYFKRNYELSPVDYRSRCRVMESMVLLLLREKNVTQAGFEVGFEDCSSFFRQFKRQTQVSPSQFLEPKAVGPELAL